MVLSEKLTNIIEQMFNCILQKSASFHVKFFNRILIMMPLFHVRFVVNLSLSESDYIECIEKARNIIHLGTKSTSQHFESDSYITYCPIELLDLILIESVVGIMSSEWMKIVRVNESVSGYETVSNETWMSAYICLESVTYQWMHLRCLKQKSGSQTILFTTSPRKLQHFC